MSVLVRIRVDVDVALDRKQAVQDALRNVLGCDTKFDPTCGDPADPWLWAECETQVASDYVTRAPDEGCAPVARDIARACFDANGGPLAGMEIRVQWLEETPSDTLDVPAGTLLVGRE